MWFLSTSLSEIIWRTLKAISCRVHNLQVSLHYPRLNFLVFDLKQNPSKISILPNPPRPKDKETQLKFPSSVSTMFPVLVVNDDTQNLSLRYDLKGPELWKVFVTITLLALTKITTSVAE